MHAPPLLSDHRRRRLQTWAGLWLLRLAACLAVFAPHLLPPVAPIRRLILDLLVIRAADFAPPPQRRRAPIPRRAIRVNLRRALLGARTRRLLRAPTLGARITKLLDLLRDLDAHARRIARRLTRLRPLPCAPMAAEALAQGMAPLASTDTS